MAKDQIGQIEIPKPYLIFMGDVTTPMYAKTGAGLRDWAPTDCIGQVRLTPETVDLGLADMTLAEGHGKGARTVVVGSAPIGGSISDTWIRHLCDALEMGMNVASGMHQRLADDQVMSAAARDSAARIFDVRHTSIELPIATGLPRGGKRLLTVGTDCAQGKKYTALSICRAATARGLDVDFRATGQTGILISGAGIPMDGVKSDFLAGAAELLSPDANDGHWDVIEGQGSLFHPAYAGVTLGLLHGSQPDLMVLCHNPKMTELGGFPGIPVTPLDQAIEWYETAARLTSPNARVAAISLRTDQLSEEEGRAAIDEISQETGLACFDPIKTGVDAVVEIMENT